MSRYTEKLILQSFGEMLHEMPFDKITVSALTRRSDVSHNTFYYRYHDIFDLLKVWIRKETAPYLAQDRLYPDWETSVAAMLKSWQKDSVRIYHIYHSASRSELERCVFEQLEGFFYAQVRCFPEAETIPDKQLKRISDVACYIFLGFLSRFLWGGMEMDVDESVHELTALLKGFLRHAIADARDAAE